MQLGSNTLTSEAREKEKKDVICCLKSKYNDHKGDFGEMPEEILVNVV